MSFSLGFSTKKNRNFIFKKERQQVIIAIAYNQVRTVKIFSNKLLVTDKTRTTLEI